MRLSIFLEALGAKFHLFKDLHQSFFKISRINNFFDQIDFPLVRCIIHGVCELQALTLDKDAHANLVIPRKDNSSNGHSWSNSFGNDPVAISLESTFDIYSGVAIFHFNMLLSFKQAHGIQSAEIIFIEPLDDILASESVRVIKSIIVGVIHVFVPILLWDDFGNMSCPDVILIFLVVDLFFDQRSIFDLELEIVFRSLNCQLKISLGNFLDDISDYEGSL